MQIARYCFFVERYACTILVYFFGDISRLNFIHFHKIPLLTFVNNLSYKLNYLNLFKIFLDIILVNHLHDNHR